MAARVNSRAPVLHALWALALAASAAAALPDPTRPPGGVTAASGAGGRSAQAAPGGEQKGLQAVVIAPGRRLAIIDGNTVELGAKYGGYTLVEVREGAVVLRNGTGRQKVMTLFPETGIKPEHRAPAQQREKGGTDGSGKQGTGKADLPMPPPEAK